MQAQNEAAGCEVFRSDDVNALRAWSDRIIQEIEIRTGFVLNGRQITVQTLPRCATIRMKMRQPSWANNHPRSRGITHVVQVVRRPEDGEPFISESFDGVVSRGINLTPLKQWLAQSYPGVCADEIWAVDPFLLAAKV